MKRFFTHHVRAWALAFVVSISAIAFADYTFGLKDMMQDDDMFAETASQAIGQIAPSAVDEINDGTSDEDTKGKVVVYLKNDANWATPINCYVYKNDSDKKANWPGEQMTYDEATGLYYLDITSYNDGEAYCIFSHNGADQYPASGAQGLATGGTSKLYNNSTKSAEGWTSTFTEKPVVTMTESQNFSTRPFSVSISVTDAYKAYYTINDGDKVEFTDSTTLTIRTTSTVKVTATNTVGTTEQSATYTYDGTDVIVYVKNDAGWTEPIYCYAYSADEKTNTGERPGAQMKYDESTGLYSLNLSEYGLEDSYCIFSDKDTKNRYPADNAQGLATGGTSKIYRTGDTFWDNVTETVYEMVATCNGETVVKPLTAMRVRESGPKSTTYFAVGFKDEQLPGNTGDDVKVYVRQSDNTSVQYRPADNTMGNAPSLLASTNLTDFRCNNFMSTSEAASSSNAISIKKGAGVSYTVGLNLGAELTATYQSTVTHPISYTIKKNSLCLYTNKSLDDLYGSISMTSGTYKNKNIDSSTKKSDLEDYYICGSIYGAQSSDDADKYGYRSPQSGNWKDIASYYKMEKQLFLNPNDKEKVDSIVYSKVIKKPKSGYDNMFMAFTPQSLINATGLWGEDKNSYNESEKWNYVVRPEVFDQQDGRALRGSTLVSGVEAGKRRNGEQSLNPMVDNSKEYFIIRLNTTTSTYRVEFINSDEVSVNKYGIRTFCSRFNYIIPDGFAAYAAQSFETSENTSVNGQAQGTVKLRRLKFIPANEPVVLIYNATFKDAFNASNESISEAFTVITDGAGDENKYLEIQNNEGWWYNTYPDTETYNNLLVACLDNEKVPNGKYHLVDNKYYYDYRNFALNMYHNTKYYKENKTGANYVGFFRLDGTIKAGYAYLRLTDKDMNFNGQLLGDVTDSNVGDESKNVSQAKFTLAFDVDPWDDVTSINKVVDNDRQADDAYYNLQGMKVKKPTKGLYIHNGKKVIVK